MGTAWTQTAAYGAQNLAAWNEPLSSVPTVTISNEHDICVHTNLQLMAEVTPEAARGGTFTPEDRKPVKAKHVYLRSRDPAIFTRLEIEHINANKDFFRLSGKSVTNPYGDRNLEQATDLPYEVTKQLTDDAKAAFRQNKRPEKPDLSKLVKEAKEKAEKDKGKP